MMMGDNLTHISAYLIGAFVSATICIAAIYIRKYLAHKTPYIWSATVGMVIGSRERLYYRLLRETFPALQVMMKVTITHFIKADSSKTSSYWLEKLNALSVSFLLCTREGRPYAAFDLSDSKASAEALKLLAVKRAVLDAAGVRLIELPEEPFASSEVLKMLAQDDYFEHGATIGDVSRIMHSRSHQSDFSVSSQAFSSTRDQLAKTVESMRHAKQSQDTVPQKKH
jgi:hypothetical protein